MTKLFAYVLACFVAPIADAASVLNRWHYDALDRRRKRRIWRRSQREARRILAAANRRYSFARNAYAVVSTKMHTDLTQGAPGNVSVVNAPLNQLDAALADVELQFGDFVVAGGLAGTSASLTIAQPAIRAFVLNTYINIAGQNLTAIANDDNYVDLDNTGVYHVSSVANGAGAPVVFANSIRLYKAVAGAATVTSIADLRPLVTPLGNLPPVFNVKNYGAKGDGATDDYPAILAAINAMPATGGILFFPAGIYVFKTAIVLNKHIRVWGSGRDLDNTTSPTTVLSYQPAGAGTTGITSTVHGNVLEGFVLIQGNAQATTKGLVIQGAFSNTVRDATILSFTGYGYSILATASASCIWNSTYNVRVSGCTAGGLQILGDAGSSHTADANAHYSCQFLNNGTTNNVSISSFASNNGFYNCDFSTCPGGSMVTVGDATANPCRGNSFYNPYLESSGTTVGFNLLNSCQVAKIDGAHFIATTPVQLTGSATCWFQNGDSGALSSQGSVTGVRIDAAGGIALNAGVQGANTINGLGGWVLMSSGSVLVTLNSSDLTVAKILKATAQIYPADVALATQSSGGLLHATAVPSNANGNNNDWCISDNGHQYRRTGGVWVDMTATVTALSTPANPVGTASAVGVMMGLAGAITPVRTGNIEITISGDCFNNTLSDGVNFQIRTGTGTAPVNAAALTGTAVGAKPAYTAGVASMKSPFSITVIVTGLALGTAVWIDLAVAAVTGGTATVENITIAAKEI